MAFQRPNPLLIPELARMLCDFVDQSDLLNLALTCKFLFYPACERLWKRLNPRSLVALRKIKNTLDGKYKRPFTINYSAFVWEFLWTASNDQRAARFERDFFHIFRFPFLQRLEFSFAAAQDATVVNIMANTRHLQHVDFSHCYCLTTDAIRPLLTMPPGQLKTLILYGCGQIDRRALVYLIHRHASSLTYIGLTDINDHIMFAIQKCPQLQALGLEHCSDTDLTEDAITQFCNIMKAKNMRLQQLRVRDIQSLTTEHVCDLARTCADTLRHLDMSECVRVSQTAFLDLSTYCTRIETFSIGYQAEVTNCAISKLLQNCMSLKNLDVAGCFKLSSEAFQPILDDELTFVPSLETLNITNLETEISSSTVINLLNRLRAIREITLGVAYDLSEANKIVHHVNAVRRFIVNDDVDDGYHDLADDLFFVDVEQCHTIRKLLHE
ncbi:hypothetical protein K450DRAFT_231692 [Umbelopsis ramanniana AG]|uniref:F-box domain-containing protein n=1 Tax=Umbelopsis ramanniana AG TaxID=1314678 RepID=A0AAD5HFX7_UMBRA|nr:uncharacterized protein K450DRAFT_231692 [Umbelopsis ramanniana AG]KAI8581519.1 hypothetical protein K450DRAFT_231692 [Umbelopsis ramanniana AG]